MALTEEVKAAGTAHERTRLQILPILGARDDGDQPLGLAGLEARLEHERAARDAAETASRRKSELVASVSHELRTPMGCIVGLADLVLATNLTPEQREHLALLRASAGSLLGVLNGLLDLAKIEAGRMELELGSFSLRDLLREATHPLVLAASDQGVVVETHVAAAVPDRLVGAATGLRQIITNLVANALRFTPQGTVGIHVDAEREATGCLLLRVAVRDTGVGIRSEYLPAIFEAFEQASPGAGGTGLGLAISRQIAGLMGGRIEVESVEGVGSAFRLLAPFTVDAADADVPRLPRRPAPSPSHGPLRVLVAEDHPVSRRFLDALLRRAGHRVTLAANGRQALALLDRERFDVVLMDGHMPAMDGFETTRAIREREQRARRRPIPIVALTASAMREDRQRFLVAGFDAYLSKPVEGPQMLRVLEAIVFPGRQRPMIDAARLLQLARGDAKLARRLIDDLVAAAPADVAQLRAALAREDTPHVLATVHRLQGALAQLGGVPAVDMLARVPALYEAGARGVIDSLLADLETRIMELPRCFRLGAR